MNIVYRVGGDGFDSVLFAERGRAEYVAQIRQALAQSRTWGEFQSSLPEGEWEKTFVDSLGGTPESDEIFTADQAPGHADGDFPEWLRQSQLEWFPNDLIEKFGGEVSMSVLNGPMLDLPAGSAEEIADELRRRGHVVERTELDIT